MSCTSLNTCYNKWIRKKVIVLNMSSDNDCGNDDDDNNDAEYNDGSDYSDSDVNDINKKTQWS